VKSLRRLLLRLFVDDCVGVYGFFPQQLIENPKAHLSLYRWLAYFSSWYDGRSLVLSTPLLGLAFLRNARPPDKWGVTQTGLVVYFWPAFPEEGGYLYRYTWRLLKETPLF